MRHFTRIKPIALIFSVAFLSTILFFSFGIAVSVVVDRHNTPISYQPTDGDRGEISEKTEKGFWHVLFHDPTAFFTGVLAIFTIVLAVATVGLILITQRGIREQSSASSQALIHSAASAGAALQALTVERAWLCFEAVLMLNINNMTLDGLFVGEAVAVQFSFINTGRSPCLLKSIKRKGQCVPMHDETVPHFAVGDEKDETKPLIVGPGQKVTPKPIYVHGEKLIGLRGHAYKYILYSIVEYDPNMKGTERGHIEACFEILISTTERATDGTVTSTIICAPVGGQNSAS